jgi:hypothetical protein
LQIGQISDSRKSFISLLVAVAIYLAIINFSLLLEFALFKELHADYAMHVMQIQQHKNNTAAIIIKIPKNSMMIIRIRKKVVSPFFWQSFASEK